MDGLGDMAKSMILGVVEWIGTAERAVDDHDAGVFEAVSQADDRLLYHLEPVLGTLAPKFVQRVIQTGIGGDNDPVEPVAHPSMSTLAQVDFDTGCGYLLFNQVGEDFQIDPRLLDSEYAAIFRKWQPLIIEEVGELSDRDVASVLGDDVELAPAINHCIAILDTKGLLGSTAFPSGLGVARVMSAAMEPGVG